MKKNTLIERLGEILFPPRPKTVIATNEFSPGTHPTGNVPFAADVAVPQRYLLANQTGAGTATVGSAGTPPTGIFTDEARAGDRVNVAVLGATQGTLLVRAAGVIAPGAFLAPAANGLAASTTAGVCIGRALTAAAAAGDLVEFAPSLPFTK